MRTWTGRSCLINDPEKWKTAARACKEATDLCEAQGYRLYYYNQSVTQYKVSDTTRVQLNIRNAVTDKWNAEIIWGNTNSMVEVIQRQGIVRGLDPSAKSNATPRGNLAPPLKIVELFYSDNGVPITEDKQWNYSKRFELKKATANDRYNIKEGYITAALNFNREPRFYASLGFDGGIWYGQGRFDDNDTWHVEAKKLQAQSGATEDSYSVTGYWPKKLINIKNVMTTSNYTIERYPWPVIRLADLYLLYAEALNEAEGPGPEVYKWLNLVRERAGLQSVEDSWTNYSIYSDKYKTKEGLREIIHRERTVELMFEGQRYWDLRRWKEALTELNKPITGWDIEQETEEGYYRENVLYRQLFRSRDYFWPVKENELLTNRKVVQSYGW